MTDRIKEIEKLLQEVLDNQYVLMDMLNAEVVEFDAEDDCLPTYELN